MKPNEKAMLEVLAENCIETPDQIRVLIAAKAELDERIRKNQAKGGKWKKYTVEVEGRKAWELHEKGKSWREAGKELNLSFSTARRLGEKYEKEFIEGKPLF